ncbi:unnamed protein product [Durusdinium trenchii]|uniref:Uncharacterized protein n=2 Tax=Durusdinium trenchii TaxID=1381693 RepID=A0ABP0NZ20_9DINO
MESEYIRGDSKVHLPNVISKYHANRCSFFMTRLWPQPFGSTPKAQQVLEKGGEREVMFITIVTMFLPLAWAGDHFLQKRAEDCDVTGHFSCNTTVFDEMGEITFYPNEKDEVTLIKNDYAKFMRVGLHYGVDNHEIQHCAKVPSPHLTYRCAIVETVGQDPNARFHDAFTDYVFNDDCSAFTKVGTHLSNTAVVNVECARNKK